MNDVRLMSVWDCESVAELYGGSFPEHIMVQKGLLNDPDYFVSRLDNSDELWVVNSDNSIINGVAALVLIPPVGLGEIERVCVDREYRGNGIAQDMCKSLVNQAMCKGLGFVEAFARGDEPAMQRTFQKLGFNVYGVAPRFEVFHDGNVVREQFVHMGLELKPETVDESSMVLISEAREIFNKITKGVKK